MKYIKAEQIKGARAMLGWTREELAEASGLSHGTIRNLEMGYISPRGKTLESLCYAIEEAGLEFTDDDGIRRLRPDIKIIRGEDSHDKFFDTLLRTVKKKGGEVIGVFRAQSMMIQAFGPHKKIGFERLRTLLIHVDIRCLFLETSEPPPSFENYECRMTPKYCNNATPYFVFGNSYVVVQPSCEDSYRFVIFNDIDLALGNKDHFDLVWDMASPLFMPVTKEEKEPIRA